MCIKSPMVDIQESGRSKPKFVPPLLQTAMSTVTEDIETPADKKPRVEHLQQTIKEQQQPQQTKVQHQNPNSQQLSIATGDAQEHQTLEQRIDKMNRILEKSAEQKELSPPSDKNSSEPQPNQTSQVTSQFGESSKIHKSVKPKRTLKTKNKTGKGETKKLKTKETKKGPKYDYFAGFSITDAVMVPLNFGWNEKVKSTKLAAGTSKNPIGAKVPVSGNIGRQTIVPSDSVRKPKPGCNPESANSTKVDTDHDGSIESSQAQTDKALKPSDMQGSHMQIHDQMGINTEASVVQPSSVLQTADIYASGMQESTMLSNGMQESTMPSSGKQENIMQSSGTQESIMQTRQTQAKTTTEKQIKKRPNKRSRFKCDKIDCSPCSVLVNCQLCYFCINRAKLK